MAKNFAEPAYDDTPPVHSVRLRIRGLIPTGQDGVFEMTGVVPMDWQPQRLEELLKDSGVDEDDRMYLNEVIYRKVRSHTLAMALSKRMEEM